LGFTFLVWNVEKFKTDNKERTKKVAQKIYEHNPDVFGLLEFKARGSARSLVTDYFPDYDFAFTYTKMNIEILVGWRRGYFKQVLYTQRRDLAASENLRPGGLVSFQQRGDRFFHNILFLHLDSGGTTNDYNNRRDMYKKIWKLNSALKKLKIQNKKSRLIVLGDLNVMGKEEGRKVSAKKELDNLKQDAKDAKMEMLEKSFDFTWKGSGRYPDSDLDHVIASSGLKFERWISENESKIWEIEVDGWNNLDTESERRKFAREISDHSPLIGRVTD